MGVFQSVVSAERMQFPKPTSMCSEATEDCAGTGCCKTTGQKCWAKDSKSAFCKQDCPSDWDCTDLTQTRDLEVVHSGSSLYCYALWFSTKGGKSKVPDDELLAWQLKNDKSIFACQAWDVFRGRHSRTQGSTTRIAKASTPASSGAWR